MEGRVQVDAGGGEPGGVRGAERDVGGVQRQHHQLGARVQQLATPRVRDRLLAAHSAPEPRDRAQPPARCLHGRHHVRHRQPHHSPFQVSHTVVSRHSVIHRDGGSYVHTSRVCPYPKGRVACCLFILAFIIYAIRNAGELKIYIVLHLI